MADAKMFDTEVLNGVYSNDYDIDLSWMRKPTQHQFRWRTLTNRWITSPRRVRDGSILKKAFGNSTPSDVYVSTSSWLNPVDLPRLRDQDASYPILLDHLVVFDIDIPPFSEKNMELARDSAFQLYQWMSQFTEYEFMHITFSGSKGFHLFYRDMQREKFQIPDPRKREESVRSARKDLLEKVLEAGFQVDSKITADTRRIIRLPGTFHGKTGWKCTIIDIDWLSVPFAQWKKHLPKHEFAIAMPMEAENSSIVAQQKEELEIETKAKGTLVSLEVSSHVAGTKNRSSLIGWLPISWGEPQIAVEKALQYAEKFSLGACCFWTDGTKTLLMVPRAIPREQLIKITKKMGMFNLSRALKEREHDWVRISGEMNEQEGWERMLTPINVLAKETNIQCTWPWSSSHLVLAQRMGLDVQQDGDECSGSPEPSVRIVRRA